MILSFTLDEKTFSEISPKNLIEKAMDNGVSSFELSADTEILTLNEYKNIINIVSNNNLELNYHIPYFANEIYELKNFSLYENTLKEKYISFLNLLELFQEKLNNKPIIVMHGADYVNAEKLNAMDNTLKFIDWMLNIISKKNLPFTLAVETLRKKDIRNTLDNREDIFNILNQFKSDHLKICWDICHDKLNFYPNKTKINDEFLSQVVYSHIHGHDLQDNISHISLNKSDIDYTLELQKLSNYGFKGAVNIELLSQFAKNSYLDDLFKDIDYINKL